MDLGGNQPFREGTWMGHTVVLGLRRCQGVPPGADGELDRLPAQDVVPGFLPPSSADQDARQIYPLLKATGIRVLAWWSPRDRMWACSSLLPGRSGLTLECKCVACGFRSVMSATAACSASCLHGSLYFALIFDCIGPFLNFRVHVLGTQPYWSQSDAPRAPMAFSFPPPAQGWDSFMREVDQAYWEDYATRTCGVCGTTSWNQRTPRTWCHCKVRKISFWIPCKRRRWKRNRRGHGHSRLARVKKVDWDSQALCGPAC